MLYLTSKEPELAHGHGLLRQTRKGPKPSQAAAFYAFGLTHEGQLKLEIPRLY
jgi:hypothetical protein